MKRKLLSLLVLLMTAVSGAWADSWTSGDCTVTLSGGVMTVSGTGAMANYSSFSDIPWYSNKDAITSVVIESGVTNIGNGAFYKCTNLASVDISATVTSIGKETFAESGSSTGMAVNIATGSALEAIGDKAFLSSNLASITLPEGLTTIGKNAFKGCGNLATVTLNSNPFIGDDAFNDIKAGAAVTMNLTANSAGGAYWMTFYNKNYSFEADANTQVFKVALTGIDLTMNKVGNRIVDAGTAVVLKSSGDPVMTLTTTASSDEQANNLKGVSDAAGLTSDGTMYVLNNGNKGVGFYKLKSDKKVGVGKAYLTYSGSGAGAREFFGFEDETTGLKAIDNGQLTIDNVVYDLQGRRVQNPTKGLYIVNGKKVVIK